MSAKMAKIIRIKTIYKKAGGVAVERTRGKGLEKYLAFPVHLCIVSIKDSFAYYLQDLGPPAYGDKSERAELQRTPKIKKQITAIIKEVARGSMH